MKVNTINCVDINYTNTDILPIISLNWFSFQIHIHSYNEFYSTWNMPGRLPLFTSKCFRFFRKIMTVELATYKLSTYHYPRHYKNINSAQNRLLFIWHLTISHLGDYPQKSSVLCMFSVLHFRKTDFPHSECRILVIWRKRNKGIFLFGFPHFRRWWFHHLNINKIFFKSTKINKFNIWCRHPLWEARVEFFHAKKKNTNCNQILVFRWMLIILLI